MASIAHSTTMEEQYEKMKDVLEQIEYAEPN